MILYCEECGMRHDIDQKKFTNQKYQFTCNACNETLLVTVANRRQSKTLHAAMQHDVAESAEFDAEPLKILIVDDSKLIRKVLRKIIESDDRKEVAGEAENGKKALDLLKQIKPDVITLDINMPVMDGLTTLKYIMINHPTPTVMVSALTKEGALETFDSLKYGAIDFLPKPSQIKGGDLKAQQNEILHKIELAAEVEIETIRFLRSASPNRKKQKSIHTDCQYIAAIGVSEGGYGALLNVVPRLKPNMPAAYVVVMHAAPHHIDAFTRYLDQCSSIPVERATDGIIMQAGSCYLAATTEYVDITKNGSQIQLQVNPSPFPMRRGAVNMLMSSIAHMMSTSAVGVLLTGTGDDGIDGLGEIINAGGAVFVQDPRTCLFKETPVAATEKYAIHNLVSDKQMAGAINSFLISQNR